MSRKSTDLQRRKAELELIKLKDDSGLEVEFLNLGASIRSLRVPGRNGPVNAVLSYPDPIQYLDDPYYIGSTLGRYANRIDNASYSLNGQVIRLTETPGAGGHCLHGGKQGFSQRIWESVPSPGAGTASFRIFSEDGDQGFPGKVEASVNYSLLGGRKLLIEFLAVTDSITVINLANHAYFNLNDDGSSAENHLLKIHADAYTPLGPDLIPTGEILGVAGTEFDFRNPSRFADRLNAENEELGFTGGFDHNFVLKQAHQKISPVAELRSPQSGLRLKVHTTQPGLQFYSGQYLSEPFRAFEGLCLEAQGLPNAPNTTGFPSAVLHPGMQYHQMTMYEFGLDT